MGYFLKVPRGFFQKVNKNVVSHMAEPLIMGSFTKYLEM